MLQQTQTGEPKASLPQCAASPLGLVDFNEMCRLLGVTRPTMAMVVKDPAEKFPSFTIGKRRFARLCDIDAWLANKAHRGHERAA